MMRSLENQWSTVSLRLKETLIRIGTRMDYRKGYDEWKQGIGYSDDTVRTADKAEWS